jgi:epidermal growth factor receptor substrate 15
MINTLYLEKSGKFQRKKAQLTVQAIVENKGTKKVGTLSLNISDYSASPLNNKPFALEGCPDKNARIIISVRAQALGEATAADNMSEASGVTGFSMGTEGDFQGNLFNEQDLGGFEDDQPKVIMGSHGKPPLVRPGMMKLPDSGPVNPMKIAEAMDNQRMKLEEESSAVKTSELKASVQILEKENLQLKSEKDDLKVQLSISLEKSKKERENYFEHMKKLDAEIESLKKKNESLNERVGRRDEKIASLKKENENMLSDMKDLEKKESGGTEEKEKTKAEIDRLKRKLEESDRKLREAFKDLEKLKDEKHTLESNNGQLNVVVSQLRADIENLRHDLSESRDAISVRGSHEDLAFENYKKKTEALINNYKRDIKTLEHEREEALSRQTDMTFELQKAKTEILSIDERNRQQIIRLEKENENLKEEIIEIRQKVEEEMQSRKVFERKSSIEKSDYDSKFNKVIQAQQELKSKKETLEQTVTELERQLKKKQIESESDQQNLKKLQEKYEKFENKVREHKEYVKAKNRELDDLYSAKESLEQENMTLRSHLKTATTTEFSDPANIILQEQVEALESKLKQTEQLLSKEKSSFNEKTRVLENQVSILEKKKKEMQENFEDQLHKLTVENRMLKDAESSKHVVKNQTSNELIAEMQKESNNQTIQLLKIDFNEMKAKYSDLQEEYKSLEKKYVDAKMGWANADLEKENIVQKYRDAQEQLRDYSAQYTVMEVEMYKINERFGQTLNLNNELELEVNNLRSQIAEAQGNKKRGLFGRKN